MAYTTINKSTDYFNTKLYTGTGSSNAQTGIGHQPDLVWIKSRSASWDHELYDAVRGVGKTISSVTTNAESNASQGVTAFGSDGFTVGTRSGVNENNSTYASWNWKAGTTGSGTTGGSGTAKAYSYSVNTTAGFSIVKYAGNGAAGHTIPHHLGVVPKIIIIKDLTDNEAWRVYHVGLGNFAKYLELNSTAGETTDSSVFDNVPTSSGFLVGSANPVNNATHDYIAYCFAPKTGYSKFGSYTGNGADGSSTNNFIYTGFKPAWVMVKRSNDSSQQWTICDTTRSPSNVSGSMEWLFPDNSGAETDEDLPYMLSNGFMPRTGHTYMNRSGFSYIYMAFGQSLVGSNNVPCTAR